MPTMSWEHHLENQTETLEGSQKISFWVRRPRLITNDIFNIELVKSANNRTANENVKIYLTASQEFHLGCMRRLDFDLRGHPNHDL